MSEPLKSYGGMGGVSLLCGECQRVVSALYNGGDAYRCLPCHLRHIQRHEQAQVREATIHAIRQAGDQRDRDRIRRWRTRIYTRIQFAIGLILLAYAWLTLLPALWWSDIGRNAALALTVWFVFAQAVAFRWLWRWLSPSWRRETGKETV